MKIDKIIKEDPMWTYMLSATETRRVADLLEQSKEFEEKINYLRRKYKIPDTGYPFPEDPKDYFKYAIEVILDAKTLDSFFDEAREVNKSLNLPNYWWSSIAYFAFHNAFFTPERIPLEVKYMNFEQYPYSGTHLIIKEKMSKSQVHYWIDELWEEIEKEMKSLPEAKGHRMIRSEIAKKIVEMKDSTSMTFAKIADSLQKEYQDAEFYDSLNENNVKTLYHRWKAKLKK